MTWLQISLDTTSDRVQALADALSEAGAVSVSIEGADDEPLFEVDWNDDTPVWKQTRVVALFEEGTDTDAAMRQVAELLSLPAPPACTVESLADQDWERAWMDRWKPMHFGGDLWVIPSWLAPVEPDATNLVLDPGLAFGTGTHATTAMCLEWLAQHPPYGREIIDFGCGSGILAIAALMLGADRALGTDTDPQALIVSRENAERNAVADRLALCLPGEMSPDASADIVLANILAGPLVLLASRLMELVRPRGVLILSGLLATQVEEVQAAYATHFDFEITLREEWALLVGRPR